MLLYFFAAACILSTNYASLDANCFPALCRCLARATFIFSRGRVVKLIKAGGGGRRECARPRLCPHQTSREGERGCAAPWDVGVREGPGCPRPLWPRTEPLSPNRGGFATSSGCSLPAVAPGVDGDPHVEWPRAPGGLFPPGWVRGGQEEPPAWGWGGLQAGGRSCPHRRRQLGDTMTAKARAQIPSSGHRCPALFA